MTADSMTGIGRHTHKRININANSHIFDAKTPRYFGLRFPIMSIKNSMIALAVCSSSVVAQAAILQDSSERRIQVRQGTTATSNDSSTTKQANHLNQSLSAGDSMQGLIKQKQREYEFDAKLSIEENKRVYVNRADAKNSSTYSTTNNHYGSVHPKSLQTTDFNSWLNSIRFRAQEVANYKRYLSSQLGAQNVPPLEQLLTTARSWDKCGYEPYQLPPQELWSNIVPTLRLYSALKNQGVLPPTTEIRSVYRSPGLNRCAGGASSSKHMTASAIDIWVPEYQDNFWLLSKMQDGLCQFWQYQGQSHRLGLGLYSTGAVHLDTQGYRKWGFNHATSSSSCRY